MAYRKLRASGFFKPDDTVVLFNTGSGLKYLDVLDQGAGKNAAGTSVERTLLSALPEPSKKPAPRQIAGIIGPY